MLERRCAENYKLPHCGFSVRLTGRVSLSHFLSGCHMISGHQISGSGRTRVPLFSSFRRFTVK